jgi:diguanylate cyclase (GGDEF)-like protein
MNKANRALQMLIQRSKIFPFVIGLAGIALLSILDYITGYEISFALFYLIPTSFVAWYSGFRAGAVIAVLSAISWQFVNYVAGETFSNPMIPYWNAATRLGFFLVVIYLLGELKSTIEIERKLSRTDDLTGALNRRAFYELVKAEILRHQRYHTPFAISYLDIDNFKTINDRFGHSAGDRVLRNVVEIVKANLRATDSVARFGGDEFAILLLETNYETTCSALERLMDALLCEMERNDWAVTFSVGGVVCTTAPESVDELIQGADRLMYRVKNAGKNNIHCTMYEALEGAIEQRTE